MKLTESEILFVKETCEFYTDQRIADEITRIRRSMGILDGATKNQVFRAREKLGLYKTKGAKGED
jgi:hypothetical protein